jgi:hypothetical protein
MEGRKLMASSDGKYQPFRDLRFYPGYNLSDSRQQELTDLAVDADELSGDDIAWTLGTMWTRAMYTMLEVARSRVGEKVAQELAEEFGYRLAKGNLLKWMKAHHITKITPEEFARFQDNRHALGGAKHAQSYISYDGTGVQLYRTGCGYHDNRPEGLESFCKYSAPGFFRGYAEVDPRIKAEMICCRSRGDATDHCELRFMFDESASGTDR